MKFGWKFPLTEENAVLSRINLLMKYYKDFKYLSMKYCKWAGNTTIFHFKNNLYPGIFFKNFNENKSRNCAK